MIGSRIWRRHLGTLVALVVAVLSASPATAQGTPVADRRVLAAAGGWASGGTTILVGDTLGENAVGVASVGAEEAVVSGFWPGVVIEDDETRCEMPGGLTGSYGFNNGPEVWVEVMTPGDLTCLRVHRVPGPHPGALGTIDPTFFWTITGMRDGGDPASGYTVMLKLPVTGLANPLICRHITTSTPPDAADWDCGRDGMDAKWVWREATELSDWVLADGPVPVSLQFFTVE